MADYTEAFEVSGQVIHMSKKTPSIPFTSNVKALFPALTEAQIARIRAHGNSRQVRRGDVLVEPGQHSVHLFIVLSGEIEVVRPTGTSEDLVAVFQHGMFTGEINVLSGRRSLVQIRASESGEVIDIDRQHLMALIQADSELSEIMLRAFILRRVEIIARGFGDAVLIGSSHCAGTLRVKEFLTRNGYPYTAVD